MAAAYGYVLFSSRDEDSFIYYGISTAPLERLRHHLSLARACRLGKPADNLWKARTIIQEQDQGHEVSVRVLFQYESEAAAYADEDVWIKSLRRAGHRLTNLAPGGVGGIAQSEENKRIYGAKMRAWHAVPENKEHLRASQAAARTRPEVKKALSDGQRRRYTNQEERDADSLRISKLYENAEYAARQREIHSSPEVIEKTKKSLELFYADPEKRAESAEHAKRGWASLSPEQHANRVLKSKLGKRLSAAKKSGWVFDLTPVHTCEVNRETV